MAERILVVDDDPDIRLFLRITLELAEFEVIEAVDGEEGVTSAIQERPALILMDMMMPRKDGLTAIKELRADGRTSHIPIIMVTARSQSGDKVEGLGAGADDYVTKPFEPDELLARIRGTLRRAVEIRTTSPLTALPGNARIELELKRRVEQGENFSVLYADLNNFKAYNDFYGFMRGDDVIKGFANMCSQVVSDIGDSNTFLGHIGGDDFVLICSLQQGEKMAAEICTRFDQLAPTFYDEEHASAGHIQIADRRGDPTTFDLVSVAVGVTSTATRKFEHPGEAVSIATEMKKYAKDHDRTKSTWAVDRRDN